MAGPASKKHFLFPLSQYFDFEFEFVSHTPSEISVYLPKSLYDNGRTVYSDSIFDGRDILVTGWTHLILKESDLFLKSAEEITLSLRIFAKEILKPRNVLSKYISHYNEFSHDYFDLGIHVRDGAHISELQQADESYMSNFWTMADYQSYLPPLLNQFGIKNIYLCGLNNDTIDQISSILLNCTDSSVFRAQYKLIDYLIDSESEFQINTRSEIEFARSELLSIVDFWFLSMCRNIISPHQSTFGALAALLGGGIRHIKYGQSFFKIKAQVFSGAAL